MKVLYAVQATGNGHLSRAMEFYPILSKKVSTDVLISGISGDLKLNFPVKYRHYGLSYIFGKKGNIDFIKTAWKLKPLRFLIDLFKLNLKDYDLIINDFEPLTAYGSKFRDIPTVALSHQASFYSDKVPRPQRRDFPAEFVLKHYAPCQYNVGIHFAKYDKNIYPPVIRKNIRELKTTNLNYNLVYLPAFSEEILIPHLQKLENEHWVIFSKHTQQKQKIGNISIFPVGSPEWTEKIANCKSAVIGAGFAATSEMLHLGKKILVIPMKRQYEQKCNSLALERFGVEILYKIDDHFSEHIRQWLATDKQIDVHFPNMSEEIIEHVLSYGK